MATSEARRALGSRNQILRQQFNRLKDKKDEIAEHLSTIIKRSKQMQQLKKSLILDLQASHERAKVNRNKKIAYIEYLELDIKKIQQQLLVQATQFKKLQGEYEICLQDYDNVLKIVTKQIQYCRTIEGEIALQKETNASVKAMIFDYQRLKRVLEEQKNYFKELNFSQQKSHEERLKQLQKIYEKLKGQQKQSKINLLNFKYRYGFKILHNIFNNKLRQYSNFLKSQYITIKKTQLGIKTFKNCLQISNFKNQLQTKRLFYLWHHNSFNKQLFKNLTQNATKLYVQSLRKMRVLNKMVQVTYDRNLALFHLYEKGKYMKLIFNQNARKDMHYGFNKWRQNYYYRSQVINKLTSLIGKTIPRINKKYAFSKWKNQAAIQSRLILANHLLNQYYNAKQIGRTFRKWRIQVSRHELRAAEQFVFRVGLRNKITSRINYEKRKTKALTSLIFKLQKIKLRNYFTKYWSNAKGYKIKQNLKIIEQQKLILSDLRVEQKSTTSKVIANNEKVSVKIFRKFMLSSLLGPVMKKWRNTTSFLKNRSNKIYHLCLSKQNKQKILVMNQFRKCVQHFEKKQMHQVLTDLNNKMQAINQKSTEFRQKLKKCIQDLGLMASKKIQQIYNYTAMNQQRQYFHRYIRNRIKKLYRQYILHRFQTIMNLFGQKKGFSQIINYSQEKVLNIKLQNIQKQFQRRKIKRLTSLAFYSLRGMVKNHKTCFQRMGQSENIVMFYRMATAFVALQRKSCSQKIKQVNKKIASNQAVLVTKSQNILNLQQQKQKLQDALKKIFTRFVNFQNINMQLKEKQNVLKLSKRYFNQYRQKVKERIYSQKIIIHFVEFVSQKNKMIFWKGANAIRYENTIASIKQELGKINRKKKAFQQKSAKGRGDTQKRLQQSQKLHKQKFQNYDYYLKKFQNTLKFYEQRHKTKQDIYYLKTIFTQWKKQYKAVKGLVIGTNKILQRNLVHFGFLQILKDKRKNDCHLKGQYLCADIIQRKAKLCMKDSITIWRCNIRKLKVDKLMLQTNQIIQNRESIVDESKQKSRLVVQERIRMRRKKMLATCFMAIKQQLTQKIYENRYKLVPFNQKYSQRLLKTAVKGLKWLMFYKRTKRAYLKFKKQKFEKDLKFDVFWALKIYRQEHYNFVSKLQGVVKNVSIYNLRFGLHKITNLGSQQIRQLNYQRRKALRHLVMNKVTKVHLIKRKLMAKWHAWLIPRYHYLPNILKNLQVTALRKYFANIREHAYWNPVYIKKAADTITSEGYTQINTATNNLVKQGYDPEQIKQYLSKNNQKDVKNIKSIVSRIKTWGAKQDMVRAWNSWKQYLVLKGKIKKSLSKVMFIAQGLGRYWNRWKSKDPQFNAILQKQSRGSMLDRYRDLGRLLKQYKRDVKDSLVYCNQLKEVNDQYAQKNDQGIKMALSALSTNIKKGMRQGLHIWRDRIKLYKREVMDQRYDQLAQGIQILQQQRNKLKYRLIAIQQQNKHMKQKCNLGKQCGQILEKLLRERDSLSIDLADKQHNLKLLLEDNLRLKQKIKLAKNNAEKLINKVHNFEASEEN